VRSTIDPQRGAAGATDAAPEASRVHPGRVQGQHVIVGAGRLYMNVMKLSGVGSTGEIVIVSKPAARPISSYSRAV
jgi:hypothetical protein